MALNDAMLTVMANSANTAWTHLQLHNGAPGAGYTTNVVGTRAATTGNSVDADGDITKVGNWTGLTANQPVTHVSYWNQLATGGTNYGGSALNTGGTNDTAANAAGEFQLTVVENGTAV